MIPSPAGDWHALDRPFLITTDSTIAHAASDRFLTFSSAIQVLSTRGMPLDRISPIMTAAGSCPFFPSGRNSRLASLISVSGAQQKHRSWRASG